MQARQRGLLHLSPLAGREPAADLIGGRRALARRVRGLFRQAWTCGDAPSPRPSPRKRGEGARTARGDAVPRDLGHPPPHPGRRPGPRLPRDAEAHGRHRSHVRPHHRRPPRRHRGALVALPRRRDHPALPRRIDCRGCIGTMARPGARRIVRERTKLVIIVAARTRRTRSMPSSRPTSESFASSRSASSCGRPARRFER